LGEIIDKMKSKVQTKSGIAVEELETAFLELNVEYENYKMSHFTSFNEQQQNYQLN
jgi:hypothetical protein